MEVLIAVKILHSSSHWVNDIREQEPLSTADFIWLSATSFELELQPHVLKSSNSIPDPLHCILL